MGDSRTSPVRLLLADRTSRRFWIAQLLYTGITGTLRFTFVWLVVTLTEWPSAEGVTTVWTGVAALIIGTVTAVNLPNIQAMVPLLVPPERLMNAAALQNGGGQAASFGGLALGGLAIGLFGDAGGFALLTVLGVVTLLLMVGVADRGPGGQCPGPSAGAGSHDAVGRPGTDDPGYRPHLASIHHRSAVAAAPIGSGRHGRVRILDSLRGLALEVTVWPVLGPVGWSGFGEPHRAARLAPGAPTRVSRMWSRAASASTPVATRTLAGPPTSDGTPRSSTSTRISR